MLVNFNTNLLMREGKKDKSLKQVLVVYKQLKKVSNLFQRNFQKVLKIKRKKYKNKKKKFFSLIQLKYFTFIKLLYLLFFYYRLNFFFRTKKVAKKKVLIPLLLNKKRSLSYTIRSFFKTTGLFLNKRIISHNVLKEFMLFFQGKGKYIMLRKECITLTLENKVNLKYLKKRRKFFN